MVNADPEPPLTFLPLQPQSDVLLLCEHASCAIPEDLYGLGLNQAQITRHIGWDIGAADLTMALSGRLRAAAVLASYSRLLIDCNRGLCHPQSIVSVSDGQPIPGNSGLSSAERMRRARLAFFPFHNAVTTRIEQMLAEGRSPVIVSVHSFTSIMGDVVRPWDVGSVFGYCARLGRPFHQHLQRVSSNSGQPVRVVLNQPYDFFASEPYSIIRHGLERNLPHILLEVRDAVLRTPEGVSRIADLISEALGSALQDMTATAMDNFV